MVWWSMVDEFRNFCMNNETEEVYQKLEEVIGVCQDLKNKKKAETSVKKSCLLIFFAPILPCLKTNRLL